MARRGVDPVKATAAPAREPRKQAERTAESRDKLIQAAIDSLNANGYSRTTLIEIGRSAGLSRSLVTFHFGTKEQLMLAVVDAIRESVETGLGVAGGEHRGLAAIDLLIDRYLLSDRESGRHIRAMYVIIIESVTSTPGLREAVANNNAVFRGLLSGWISEAFDDGEVEVRGDPDDLATLIEGLLRGVLIQYLADPEAVDLHRISVLTKRTVRQHLNHPPDA